MNPDINRFEPLTETETSQDREIEKQIQKMQARLVRPDGSEVPQHWSIFTLGESYVINNYTFKCAYIGETSILFEPMSPVIITNTE